MENIPFKKMLFLESGKKGDTEVSKFIIQPDNLRAILHDFIPPGEYTCLKINGNITMTDTPMEMNTNINFYDAAKGDVLIGGLGLGMILPAVAAKKGVRTIRVLEKNKNVIDLVWPQIYRLPYMNKVSVLEADVFDHNNEILLDTKYDAIYMDIWANVGDDAYKQMNKLRSHYKRHLKNPKFNEVMCWCYLNAKYGIKPTASL